MFRVVRGILNQHNDREEHYDRDGEGQPDLCATVHSDGYGHRQEEQQEEGDNQSSSCVELTERAGENTMIICGHTDTFLASGCLLLGGSPFLLVLYG